MYELTVDCGTCIERYELESEEAVRNFMCEHEPHYKGSTEELLSKGITNCGIDTITLEKVYDTYEVSSGTLLKSKHDGELRAVKGLYAVKDGTVVVQNYEFYYNEFDKFKYKYRSGIASSLEDIYINYNLVGEDFKLFGREDER